MAGAFDGVCQGALVFGAGTCLAARPDFAFFGCEAAQDIHLFVINSQVFVGAELANLGTRIVAAFPALFPVAVV